MKKSDLHTGMLVTLRTGDEYYVMLNTGSFISREKDILLKRYSKEEMGWLSLDNYADDLTNHTDPDDMFAEFATPEDDAKWDIVKVSAANKPADLCIPDRYKIIWIRKEETT